MVRRAGQQVPVIALTGYLGAGKTSLLNHVLRTSGSRIGVVINDFGELNVDAGLITGQIDEPASIAGGCICCLPTDGALDEALAKLADPKLRLDAIIVEASGLAEPVALARMIGFSGIPGVRPGGVVDVIDAATHFDTVDRDGIPPARYAAASLIVVNKLDQLADADREATLARIEARVRDANPRAHLVGAVGGRIDPALLYDVADVAEETGQLSFRELFAQAEADEHAAHPHTHADSVTVTSSGPVRPGALLDLLDQPPAGVYRIKGTVCIRHTSGVRSHVVHVVGTSVHITPVRRGGTDNALVAIGTRLDTDAVRTALTNALAADPEPATAADLRRWHRFTANS